MKRQIRSSVFETNSSSMHSLTVMKRDDKYTSEEILKDIWLSYDAETGEEDCVWKIYDEDNLRFGRYPFRVLATFKDKWLYACASLVCEYNDDTYKELLAIALKYIPNLKKIELPETSGSFANKNNEKYKNDEYYQKHGKTENELIEYLSQKEKDWNMDIDYWESSVGFWHYNMPNTGYVDEDILSGFLKDEGITLEEYITNKKYIVIQDGDEYCHWDNMKKSGLINMNIIDHEYPKENN